MWTNALMSKCVRFFSLGCVMYSYMHIYAYTYIHLFAHLQVSVAFVLQNAQQTFEYVLTFTRSQYSWIARLPWASGHVYFFIYIYTQALGNTLLFKLIWQSTRKEICREAKRCIISDKGFLSEWKHVRLLSIFHDFGPCGNHLFVQQWSGSLLEFFSIVFGMPWANSPNHRKLPK